MIFTTAFDNHATLAFRFSALDYLMKPVNADELQQAVQKLVRKNGQPFIGQRIDNLFRNFNTTVPKKGA